MRAISNDHAGRIWPVGSRFLTPALEHKTEIDLTVSLRLKIFFFSRRKILRQFFKPLVHWLA